jgi:hypothetical protein
MVNKAFTLLIIAAAIWGAVVLAQVIANRFAPEVRTVQAALDEAECTALPEAFGARFDAGCRFTAIGSKPEGDGIVFTATDQRSTVTVRKSAQPTLLP